VEGLLPDDCAINRNINVLGLTMQQEQAPFPPVARVAMISASRMKGPCWMYLFIASQLFSFMFMVDIESLMIPGQHMF
jgi:hypothetical protein